MLELCTWPCSPEQRALNLPVHSFKSLLLCLVLQSGKQGLILGLDMLEKPGIGQFSSRILIDDDHGRCCLLYTSDAADEGVEV